MTDGDNGAASPFVSKKVTACGRALPFHRETVDNDGNRFLDEYRIDVECETDSARKKCCEVFFDREAPNDWLPSCFAICRIDRKMRATRPCIARLHRRDRSVNPVANVHASPFMHRA